MKAVCKRELGGAFFKLLQILRGQRSRNL
jgi:hypothetical protein